MKYHTVTTRSVSHYYNLPVLDLKELNAREDEPSTSENTDFFHELYNSKRTK